MPKHDVKADESRRHDDWLGIVSEQIAGALQAHVPLGLVVEIGPGGAAVGAAVRAAGYEYAGICDRPVVLHELERAGFVAVPSDLDDIEQLTALLDNFEPIRAFVLAGAADSGTDPSVLVRFLSTYSAVHGAAALIVAEPNAGHIDVALHLLTGGGSASSVMLGQPMSRGVTGGDLARLLDEQGWRLLARHDLQRAPAQPDDSGSLALAPSLVGDFLRHVGAMFNPDATVSQFVWVLSPMATPSGPLVPAETPGPLVSILMRTQGARNELLTEALYSVYAQSCEAYEVVICFHNPGGTISDRRLGVEQVIAGLPSPLRDSISLIECVDPGRGAPLNAMLESATGVYASVLDDDDLLFDHHVETIRLGVEQHGRAVLFQTFASQRLVDPVPATGNLASAEQSGASYPYTVVGMAVPWAKPVEPIQQHFENMVPICCLAVPLALIRQTSLRFRTDLDLGEEWAFWMEAMQFLRVVVLPEVTAVVNHWNNSASNAMLRPDLALVWRSVRDTRHAAAAPVPLLLDGAVRPGLAAAGHQSEELAWLRQELATKNARLANIYKSRAWRLTRGIWWLRDRLRRRV